MTSLSVSLVDLYVFREPAPDAFELLLLRRGQSRSRPGSWEAVHGHIEERETPVDAALRELEEETGMTALRLYNLSRVELFYRHTADAVALVPVFAARVDADAPMRLSEEHDAYEWLPADRAATRYTWPRERRATQDLTHLLSAATLETVVDVLGVDLAAVRAGRS